MTPTPRLFCFGLGYTAQRLAQRLAARGFAIAGTTRDVEAKAATLPADWQLFGFDADADDPRSDPALDAALAKTTHLLHSIMPGAAGDPVLRWHAARLDALPRTQLRWIAYLSTTGVYGDHGGAWIDEDTPRRPSKARTRRRVEAEDAWLQRGAQVFRLAGIYGPGRSALERVESGRAQRIVKPGKFFNRIHVDDIATVLEASLAQADARGERPREGRAFNVSDGHPSSSAEVIAHAAQLLGVEPPPEVALEDAQLSAMARSFWTDNARVANARICSELGVQLAYPDYRAGLEACLTSRPRRRTAARSQTPP